MAAPMTFEDVEQEAAAKQRAFDSQQAKASTSGSSHEKGGSRLSMRFTMGVLRYTAF